MNTNAGPALTLGRRQRVQNEDKLLADRIRMVLETRPGSLPYRKDFGCRLDDVVGQAATSKSLAHVRAAVTQALARWLPDVTVASVSVRVVPRGARLQDLRYPEVPVGERALLALGTQADIEVGVEIRSANAVGVVRSTISL